jgi:hypothetical protein
MTFAAFLSPFGVPYPSGTLELALAPQGLWRRIPAQLTSDGRILTLVLLARISGIYALHFEDEIGVGNLRLLDLRVLADPAPSVNLERPSKSHDSLDVLPNAEITLGGSARRGPLVRAALGLPGVSAQTPRRTQGHQRPAAAASV